MVIAYLESILMGNDLFGLCARCFKRHAGRCIAAGVVVSMVAGPPLASAKDGQPHGKVQPIVVTGTVATTTGPSTITMSFPNSMFPGPNYSAPAPLLWQFVKQTPDEIVWLKPPKKPDKA